MTGRQGGSCRFDEGVSARIRLGCARDSRRIEGALPPRILSGAGARKGRDATPERE
jgi:hypothetical protein